MGTSSVSLFARCLFLKAGDAFTPVKFCHDLRRVDFHVGKEDVKMKQQVRRLADQLFPVVADRGDHGFHRLLATLLGNPRPPACEQAGGVGCGRIRSPAGTDGGVKAGARVCHGGFLRDVLASRQKPVPPSTGKSRPRAATGLPCRCIGFQMDDISPRWKDPGPDCDASASPRARTRPQAAPRYVLPEWEILDRKSTRLNSSH